MTKTIRQFVYEWTHCPPDISWQDMGYFRKMWFNCRQGIMNMCYHSMSGIRGRAELHGLAVQGKIDSELFFHNLQDRINSGGPPWFYYQYMCNKEKTLNDYHLVWRAWNYDYPNEYEWCFVKNLT